MNFKVKSITHWDVLLVRQLQSYRSVFCMSVWFRSGDGSASLLHKVKAACSIFCDLPWDIIEVAKSRNADLFKSVSTYAYKDNKLNDRKEAFAATLLTFLADYRVLAFICWFDFNNFILKLSCITSIQIF